MKIDRCVICGEKRKLVKHHTHYKKDITIPICRDCHHAIHIVEKKINKLISRDDKPIKIKCKKCKYTWNYNGISPFFATCPSCLRKVKITEEMVTKKNKGDDEDEKNNSKI